MFAMYRHKGKRWELIERVHIAGILCAQIDKIADSAKVSKSDTMTWEMSGRDLCRVVGQNSASCQLVVDATYTRKDALVLSIDHIWGFSYHKWTPILIRMTVLFQGKRPSGAKTLVRHFRAHSHTSKSVHEFLYLRWGHGGCEKKSWGRVGFTNAALLWPDALGHLLGQIGFKQKARRAT